MRKTTLAVSAALFLIQASGQGGAGTPAADMVLLNGRIYTASRSSPWAEALAVRSGKIAAVGSGRDMSPWIGIETRVIDLGGKLVIPGLIDAHTHFSSGGRSLISLSFRGAASPARIREMVAARISEIPAGALVEGGGYDHSLFPGGNWPAKGDLDEVSPSNPVVIERVDGHSVWVNSLALKLAGITKETINPFGGEIRRDPATGEPTGILTEAAMGLMTRLQDKAVPSTPEQDILRALAHAARLGLTGIHTSSTPGELGIYQKLRDEGKLTLRVYAWLPVDGIERYAAEGMRRGQGDDFVRTGFLKTFIDGTLGSGTALMFSPFADDPDKSGLPQMPEPAFDALIAKAHALGYQTGTHAIGDKAVHWTLDAVEKARSAHGKKEIRHRIEHAQVIAPGDIRRFKELDVIASMQPTHCTTDMRFCERRIGRERSANAYVWRSLLDAGAKIAFGSDWPVEPLDPMRGLYSAVTRKNIEGEFPEGGWFPGQKLTVAEAVGLFTLGPAYASFEEDLKGSLEAGKLADMTVLSKDIFAIEPKEILTTEAVYTIVGGKIVYQKQI